DPGYIDDPTLKITGGNEQKAYGGRLSALWRFSSELSLKFSALAQHSRLNGSPYVDVPPGPKELAQSRLIGSGRTENSLQAYSATLNAKVLGADLISLSGYNINRLSNSFDDTPSLGPFTQLLFGVTGTDLRAFPTTKKFTQEVRLSNSVGQWLQWLIGGYYDYENSPNGTDIIAVSPFGANVGALLH